MKSNIKFVISLAAIAFAVSLTNFCTAAVIFNPPGVIAAPPPPMAVPASYVWDGRNYVGVVGSQYYYLGPGNVWLAMDNPASFNHFRAWERSNPNWRSRATRNTRYRTMGAVNPWRPVSYYRGPPGRFGPGR